MLLEGTFSTLMVTYLMPILLTSFLLIYGYVFLINRKKQPLLIDTCQGSLSERITDEVEDEVNNDDDTVGRTQQEALAFLDEDAQFVPYKLARRSFADMKKVSSEFYELMNQRRTVRFFSGDPVPIEVIENVVKTAGTSPNGINTQPWTFAVVSNQKMKERIREIVEMEEKLAYTRRMGAKWIRDEKKSRAYWSKPYLIDAPYLIVVFEQTYCFDENNHRHQGYYHKISTSAAVGILLAALHNVGLVALISSPINAAPAIRQFLGRPANEKLLALLPVGFPADNCTVPDLKRKPLSDMMVTYD